MIVMKLDRWGNEYWTDEITDEIEEKEQKKKMATMTTVPETKLGDLPHWLARLSEGAADIAAQLQELKEIDPRTIRADVLGKSAADLAAVVDTAAKNRIAYVEKETAPTRKKLRDALDEFDAMVKRQIISAEQARELARRIISAYNLAASKIAEERRREKERRQREEAEAERRARLQELEEREAHRRKEAAEQANPAVAHEAALEADRLKQEQTQLAEEPIVSPVVPLESVAPPAIDGYTSIDTWVHTIADYPVWVMGVLALLKPAITNDGNKTKLVYPGFELAGNFSGLKRSSVPLPGMKVELKTEDRNRRK